MKETLVKFIENSKEVTVFTLEDMGQCDNSIKSINFLFR
jgi:hypothetical protein